MGRAAALRFGQSRAVLNTRFFFFSPKRFHQRKIGEQRKRTARSANSLCSCAVKAQAGLRVPRVSRLSQPLPRGVPRSAIFPPSAGASFSSADAPSGEALLFLGVPLLCLLSAPWLRLKAGLHPRAAELRSVVSLAEDLARAALQLICSVGPRPPSLPKAL